MNRTTANKRAINFALTTTLAGTLLAGCATGAPPAAAVSASMAQEAMAQGKQGKAITHAEAAVLAEPRNAEFRATLASAYLDAGRFDSAAATFADTMELGNSSPRVVLGRALALAGAGKHAEAAALLNSHETDIATADLGLALAISGQQQRGIMLMSNAIRRGENTAKMRQNLAYSYALAGQWREARLMAQQDVPADKVGDRMTEWAMMAQPEAWQQRVATLLDVPAGVRDTGQPAQLALANNPAVEQLFAEAAVPTAEPAFTQVTEQPRELPALASIDPSADLDRPVLQHASAAPEPAPVVQVAQATPSATPQPAARRAPARAVAASAQQANGTHRVQLGSFLSEAGARRAWNIYTRKYPELAGHQMVISEALVGGKRYWRVSAAGFAKSSSAAMCGKVRAAGNTCFAYDQNRPLPGAVDTGVQLARR
ncbi:MAG: SPOR domain-containing protein [Porphyrobacter sp.]|nr:SPOR domain-containing protein [Porphyrobacter sp.]